VFWALVLGGLSLTLIFLGGMKPLQAASVAGSFPTMFIMAIILYGFIKKAGKEWTVPETSTTVTEADTANNPGTTGNQANIDA
jgi:choline-glycine betaine transporter